ncbi:MAG: hypothetical protein UU76_C0033G0007 [Parcubacteria group bacterium GW2011_GWC1_41_7]|nr:MAG: hypothetical protein UU76_C0033G0007 [Parcubacteria group bacterium GW2011_GWC1_41_7]
MRIIIIIKNGRMAEWLRNGLQNRVHRFNSGSGLAFAHLFINPLACPSEARIGCTRPRSLAIFDARTMPARAARVSSYMCSLLEENLLFKLFLHFYIYDL